MYLDRKYYTVAQITQNCLLFCGWIKTGKNILIYMLHGCNGDVSSFSSGTKRFSLDNKNNLLKNITMLSLTAGGSVPLR